MAGNIPRLNEASLDARVFLVAIGGSLLTSLAAGLMPAIGASRMGLTEFLKSRAMRGSSDSRSCASKSLSVPLGSGTDRLVVTPYKSTSSSQCLRNESRQSTCEEVGAGRTGLSTPSQSWRSRRICLAFLVDFLRLLKPRLASSTRWPLIVDSPKLPPADSAGNTTAAGTALAATKKGEQISIRSESLVEFRLEQPASLPSPD